MGKAADASALFDRIAVKGLMIGGDVL